MQLNKMLVKIYMKQLLIACVIAIAITTEAQTNSPFGNNFVPGNWVATNYAIPPGYKLVPDGSMSTNAPSLIALPSSIDTNVVKKDYGKYDLTLGSDGFSSTRSGRTMFQLDISLSTDPFKSIPNLWIGIDQGIGWEPSVNGSTDLSVYWPFNIYKETVYLNPGWSVGEVYGDGPSFMRTGPLIELQYYVFDNTFFYGDVNYDAIMTRGEHGLRYSLGIGIEW